MEFRLFDFNTKDDAGRFIIEMFGINAHGETAYIKVDDYQPFFYVLVNDKWTTRTMGEFIATTIEQKAKIPAETVKGELCEFNKLYWFSGDKKSKFIRLSFPNMATYYKVRNIFYDKNGKRVAQYYKTTLLQIYETKIPPLLRFFHINKISPSGWVELTKTRPNDIITTTCTFEYIVAARHIVALSNKETPVPYKIASFDIEASSSHGDFPLPVKTYKKLATQMVDIINRHIADSTPEKIKMLIRRIIMTAFSYNVYENVDKVYPKYMPKKEKMVTLIDRFLEAAVTINSNVSYLTRTENSLSEWIRLNDSRSGGGGDDDGDGDDNDGGNNVPIMSDTPDLDDVAPSDHPSFKRDGVTTAKKEYVIMDILLNREETRENKINKLNESLMSVFPQLEGDKTTFIGTTFINFGEKEPYLNTCLVLGSCDPVTNVEIQTFETESELLLGWTNLIREEDPDIIIGYNIFGFDYEFLYQRACENGVEMEFLELSRKNDEVCAKFDGFGESREMIGIESTKVVRATGEYDLRYVKMSGRLQIDMYAYLRREFNLASYKLDDVAGQFICDDIKKMEHTADGKSTILTTGNLTGIHVGDYIHIEVIGITTNYIENGRKFHICELTSNTIIIDEQLNGDWFDKKLKWGIAKDDVSPQDIFRLSNGSATDRALIAKYCVMDCNLVHHLLSKIDVITGYIEMSNICSVPISFLVFRGQGIKLTSYVAKKCREKDTLIPDLDYSFGNDEGYEGAIVLPPKCSMYMDNPVACVDYASLYPSSMISNNLSPDSKLWTKEYDLDGNLLKTNYEKEMTEMPPDGYGHVDVEFDTFQWRRKTPKSSATKVKTGKKICRFVQFPDGRRAILPAILEELLKARADTRKRIKTESDAFMRNILDKRQLAYKMTANSLYGQCGSNTSTFFEKDVAAATTATGRMMIIYAKRVIEEVYGDLVYDTQNHGPVCCRAEYIYGDSVANYTPVFVRTHTGSISLYRIDELCSRFGDGEWHICREPGKHDKEVCEFNEYHPPIETWTEQGWTRLHRIIRHRLSPQKRMFRVMTDRGLVDVTDDHSLLKVDGTEISPIDVQVGTELLHSTSPLLRIPNNLMVHGTMKGRRIYNYGQINCAITVWMALNEGCDVVIESYDAETDDYCVIINADHDETHPRNRYAVKSIEQIEYKVGEYVYDLTTENHHFAAGIGELIVHNTDSVFFTFNLQSLKGDVIRGKPALEITIEIAQDVAKVCSQYLKAPMELTYEKTLMPFILLSKKRYVGMLFENEAIGDGKLKYMGLSIKRRDSCDYLKETYGQILSILMKEQKVELAIEYLRKSLRQLIDGNVPLEKLIITRALRSDYKNPHTIPHRVLADRIGERDPGNKPKSGDRMKYLFVHPVSKPVKGKSVLMGDKVETPEYVIAGHAKIDYTHYVTNQLMNPMTQLFGLALEQILPDTREYRTAINWMMEKHSDNLEGFNKEKDKYCSKQIEQIVFDPILREVKNIVERQSTIMGFFGKSTR